MSNRLSTWPHLGRHLSSSLSQIAIGTVLLLTPGLALAQTAPGPDNPPPAPTKMQQAQQFFQQQDYAQAMPLFAHVV